MITSQILLGLVSHSQPLQLHCACTELLLKLEYLQFKSVGCICGMAEQMEQWKDSEQYGGQTREVTYRSICHSPMCPPDTAVTVWQHAAFSSDKQTLVSTCFLVVSAISREGERNGNLLGSTSPLQWWPCFSSHTCCPILESLQLNLSGFLEPIKKIVPAESYLVWN